MLQRPVILILCTGNSCRSQMAEGFLREMVGERFDVLSAGTIPQSAVHPLALQVMGERGIDISAQRPKDVKEFLGRVMIRHLVIVCDSAEQSCPRTFTTVTHRHFLPFDDPAAFRGNETEQLAEFRRVRNEIESRLRDWVAENQLDRDEA